ncbi:MAG: hypothetical protein CR977_01455 [Gammaproteobacteria bacterium]|nr:MAG: hypothetical protein CR977_01455 [Gammaproteobacteria bacterium]
MKTKLIVLLSAVLTVLGCSTYSQQGEERQEPIIADGHTSEISLDWDGVYNGFLPCASCPGIAITLQLNSDKTFAQHTIYLGEKEGYFTDKGTFAFTKDGYHIVVSPEKGTKTRYTVGENRLIMLDKDGKENATELAPMYELSKTAGTDFALTDKPIKGLLTLGHEVSTFRPCNSLTTYWINDFSDGRLTKRYRQQVGPTPTPYTPAIAELAVKDMGKAKEGFAESYESVLQPLKIHSLKQLSPENHCGN